MNTYEFTRSRIFQWLGILLALGLIAVSYWYYRSQASTLNSPSTDPISTGLAGYWALDEGTGTSATDSSTNGSTGTLTNSPTWTTGQIGGAVSFDGTNDYITITPTAAIKPQAQMTISAWVKRNASGEIDYIFWERDSAVQEEGLFFYYGSDNKVHFIFRITGTGYTDVASTTTVTDTNWHLVTVTSGNSNVTTFYIDGVNAGSGTTTTPNTGLTISSALLGARNGGGAPDFYGSITLDELRIYNRVLSPDEVAQLYRLGSATGVDTNLKGYWTFDGKDISGTTALDRSGAGNKGTLSNSPQTVEGKTGQALNFFPNGSDSNSRMTIADPSNGSLDFGSGDFAVGFWSNGAGYSNQTSSINVLLSKKNNDSAGTAGYVFFYDSTNLATFRVGNGTADSQVAATQTTVSDNTWHYYLGQRSSNTIYFYIDGVLVGSTSLTGSTSNSIDFVIGSDDTGANGNVRNVNAKIDEVRVYGAALSAGQIQSLYAQGQSDKVNSSVSQSAGTGRLDSGLAGYWALDDGSGTGATDASTKGNTGTLTNGPTWGTGQIGGDVVFDGSDDYIEIGSNIKVDNSDRGAIAAWVRWSSFPVADRPIFSFGGGTVANAGRLYLYLDFSNSKLTIRQNSDGETSDTVQGATVFTTGSWYHVAVVSNGSSFLLYVNGAPESLTVTSGSNTGDWFADTTVTGTQRSLWGRQYVNGGLVANPLNGQLDEARIYNRPLSADEIAQLYRLTTPTAVDTSLKGYWSFNAQDMPTSTTAADRSGAGNTGTLTNGPTIVEGRVGQALSFDGINDYVSTSTTNTDVFTYVAWVKWISGTGTVVGPTSDAGIQFRVDATTGTIELLHSGSASIGTSVAGVTSGVWAHIAVTNDVSGNYRFYINGSDAGGSGTNALNYGNTAIVIGSRTNTLEFFNGAIDEVRIYNRALSAAEIKSLYDVGESDKINSSVSQAQGTGRLDSGLAGYWKLDDGTGTSATDSSTNANTGTLTNGPTWTAGQIGGAVDFDGTNDYITVPDSNSLDSTDNLTISAWVKADNWTGQAAGSYSTLVKKDNNYILRKGGAGDYGGQGLKLFWWDGSNLKYIQTTTLPSTGVWHHVVGVVTANAPSLLYVDGISVGGSVATATASGRVLTSALEIGSGVSGTESFDGQIDEIRIYNRALSADEVSQLYALTAPTGTDTSLKGYWSFNGQDVSGTTAYDRSGAGNNGTLTSGPSITEGKIGQGLSFDGVDDYVITGASTPYQFANSTFTVTGWFKKTSSATEVLVAQGGCNGGWLIVLTGTLSATIKGSGACGTQPATRSSLNTTLNDGVWHHFAAIMTTNTTTAASNSTSVYIDGVLNQGSLSQDGTTYVTSAVNLQIGARNGGADNAFNGRLDEIRVYNRALSASEIQSLYNMGR